MFLNHLNLPYRNPSPQKKLQVLFVSIHVSIIQLYSDYERLYLMKHDGHEHNELDASLRRRSCRPEGDSVSWRDKTHHE